VRLLYEQVAAACDARLRLVRVPGEVLPPDLASTGARSQHLLASPAKAHQMLGWHDTAGFEVLRRSVAWHLKHPPSQAGSDFAADDAALAAR
jgi:hypothetical protein